MWRQVLPEGSLVVIQGILLDGVGIMTDGNKIVVQVSVFNDILGRN